MSRTSLALLIVVAAVVQAPTTFTVQPMSVIHAEGQEAVFECLYPAATAYSWAINGTFLSNFPPDIVTDSPSGGSPASLTIPAIPEYNNTVIQCGAIVVVGGDVQVLLSDNATLTVSGTDIDQTTFTVHPVSVTQVEGMNVVFECLYPNATSFSWAVNGTSRSVFPPGIVVVSPSGDSPASLTIPARPEYNNTVVHCEAVGEGVGNVRSESATLKVQGPLESVSNLRVVNEASYDSISIAWEAPFSLNLTNAEPDVLYYVDVYNITGGGKVIVESVNIADQYYNFSHANLSLSQEFNFTVTPVSNVPGAVNGTNSKHLQHRLGDPPVTTTSDSTSDSAGLNLGASVGGIFAALALVVIIVLIGIVVMVLVRRRKSKTVPSVESAQMTSDPTSPRYEDRPLLTKSAPHYETVELPDRPPHYETVVLPNGNRQETCISIDDDAPPVPPPCNLEDIIQHGTDSVAYSSTATVEERQIQPESHDSHMEGYVVPEPAYDVAKRVMVKESTNTGPLLGSTTTEHQCSEIGGSINKEGIHYAHVNPKPKPEGLPDQPVDPTAVVYSEVKKEKLAPKSEESEQPPQAKRAPPTPPPPTAESLFSIIHLIAYKWKEFGEALGIDEDRLDNFSNVAHDSIRLHDMVHYYFNNVHVKHMWEEFVQALRKIGEYECADKIVREKKLEGVETPSAIAKPPIPPRINKQAYGGANEAKNDSEQMSQSTNKGWDTIDEEVSTKRLVPPLEESHNSCSSALPSKEESSAGVAQESVNNLAAGPGLVSNC